MATNIVTAKMAGPARVVASRNPVHPNHFHYNADISNRPHVILHTTSVNEWVQTTRAALAPIRDPFELTSPTQHALHG